MSGAGVFKAGGKETSSVHDDVAAASEEGAGRGGRGDFAGGRTCVVHDAMGTREAGSAARQRVRALDDGALIAAMRGGDDWAWAEFDARFRARLEQYARHVGGPTSRWDECVTEVIEDAALKLTTGTATVPTNLTAYLIRALRNRAVTITRAAARRHRRHMQASAVGEAEPVVWSLCSESAIRASNALMRDSTDDYGHHGASQARRRLGASLAGGLSDEERCIIGWVAEAVPHRQIAAWLGTNYDATSKRIWRLCRRLRRIAPIHASTFDAVERAELERFFRRVGVVDTPVPAVAAGRRRGGDER
jgi:DNA-directed RNA polymerase specialized sigma24 family protein